MIHICGSLCLWLHLDAEQVTKEILPVYYTNFNFIYIQDEKKSYMHSTHDRRAAHHAPNGMRCCICMCASMHEVGARPCGNIINRIEHVFMQFFFFAAQIHTFFNPNRPSVFCHIIMHSSVNYVVHTHKQIINKQSLFGRHRPNEPLHVFREK